jgi:hypothetical protein
MLSSSVFNCRIDLATDQECQSCYVKPQHQNYYRTQGSMRFAIAIEEMKVAT